MPGHFPGKDDFSELRLDQIRHGSVLVLSKSEQLSPEETAVYRQELQELAPEAEIITGDYKNGPQTGSGACWKSGED